MAPKQATVKRPASSSMKRPASNNGQSKKLRVESESHPHGWTMTRFELDPFVRELLTVSNVAVEKSRQSHKDMRVAGGCDGSGLPHYVLQKMLALSDANVVSVCGAENVRGPALFLLKNFQFQHLQGHRVFCRVRRALLGSQQMLQNWGVRSGHLHLWLCLQAQLLSEQSEISRQSRPN